MQTEFPILGTIPEIVPMGAPKLQPRFTVDDYLATERTAFERHIYVDGEIFAMAGESLSHGQITVNLITTVASQLKGTPCQGLIKDTKVRSALAPLAGHSTKGLFSYPDIVVVCGDIEFHDAHKDIVLNPKAIIETLSPSTEAFDRGEKFTRLQQCNPSLTDYVLVSQDKPQIEHFHKPADGSWSYALHSGLDAIVVIETIKVTFKAVDVYDRVEFPKDEPAS